MMSIFFISDLHLCPSQPHLTKLFSRFLSEISVNAQAIYILGDFFAAHVGDDDHSTFMDEITHLLKQKSQSTPIFLMPGNRDFLIGPAFCERAEVNYLPDPSLVTLFGRTLWLMHGDSLVQSRGYHCFRALARSARLQKWFLKLPLAWRKNVATYMRNRSIKHYRVLPYDAEVQPPLAFSRLMQTDARIMVHGHTHHPGIYIDWRQQLWRFVLSDWHTKGHFIQLQENGRFSLQNFS